MIRAILELIVTVVVAMAARAILGSVMRGFASASRSAFDESSQEHARKEPSRADKDTASKAGDLHKDPVCGTYVAESTQFKRDGARVTFYYCSEACKEQHAVTTRS